MDFSHHLLAELLGKYVDDGPDGVSRVDYAALRDAPEDCHHLNDYISQYERLDFSKLSRDGQFAAWCNLYNAMILRHVVETAPRQSVVPAEGPGPWKTVTAIADGREISLHDIEHKILRQQWQDDPRLHYAINCASHSCPSLRRAPWVEETLHADLDEAARAYVNHPRGVRADHDGIGLSAIYKWFRADFGASEEAVIDHLLLYADIPLAKKLATRRNIDSYDYDWSLNDVAG